MTSQELRFFEEMVALERGSIRESEKRLVGHIFTESLTRAWCNIGHV